MFKLPFILCLPFFMFCSCAESLEDQQFRMLVQERIFEIDLEERLYDFGYLVSTENDPDRPQQNVFDEMIFLTTNDVSIGDDPLQGTSQVIGVEIRYIGTEIPARITSDLSAPTSDNARILTKVFIGEDFDFDTGSARRESNFRQGDLSIKVNSNGSRTININASAGGFPLVGSWTGFLQAAELQF